MNKIALIVDDAQISRQILRTIISEFEFEIHEAKDGNEAVRKALNINPDLVLMDINMPNLDGITATSEILKNIKCNIIMCTGDSTHDNVVKSKYAGAYDFITKPFNKDRVINSINSCLKL